MEEGGSSSEEEPADVYGYAIDEESQSVRVLAEATSTSGALKIDICVTSMPDL